ncbi:hypothetical protein OAK48_00390 [Deltaproteobacteria bacterium]|nr:hypothetical protein [Deltaproteobacteria bacterium]
MKQLSKIMLAAVASVALAAPSFAWDFSASGSATAYFNQTSVKANDDATSKEATIASGFSSAGASLTLASSHTDGANTTSFTYVLDNDGNLDETLTVSGSRKVGEWTASGSVAYTPNRLGCYATDNGSAASTAVTQCPDPQANTEDSTSVTLTNGTMTIVMGDAGHLSGQNVSSGSTAGGQDGMDAAGADCDVGACVDDFHGISLGYAISDTMSVTVAYQNSGDDGDLMGTGEFLDHAVTEAAAHTTSGFGIGFSGTFGPATVGFTQMSASTADATGDTDAGKRSTSWSTMGLGVAIDLGDIDPFISYGSATGTGSVSEAEHTHSGNEVGLTYALGSDTVILLIGSMEDKYSKTDKALTTSVMEVGYNTAVGPASVSVGYGTNNRADADKACGSVATSCDGFTYTDLEVAMSVSF